MGTVNPYEMTNTQLLNDFMQACAKAGISNSGLCISVFAGYELEKAHHLEGAVLARMDQQDPPFKSGDIVKPKSNQSVHSVDYWGPGLPPDKTQKVARVHYVGDGKWQLSFREIKHSEHRNPRFQADSFCLVQVEIPVSNP